MNPCILVFGMPRSGTTWIGKLFDSHPDTLYRHEPDSVQRLGLPLFPEREDAPKYRAELEAFIASLPRSRSPKVVGKQPLFPKSYYSTAAFRAYQASVLMAKVGGRVRRNIPCLYRPTAEASGTARIVWKSIESPGRLAVCVETLKPSRAIYVMRHPCGQIASVLRGEAAHRFSSTEPSADDLWLLKMLLVTATGKAHGLSLSDFTRLAPEERLAWRWVLMQEKILADVERCEDVMTVRYEDVCAAPIAMTRRMFEFTGLDWQPQSEAFIRASTHAADTDYYSVYKSPRMPAERWRSELAPEVIDRILRVLRSSSLHRYYADDAPRPAALAEVAT